MVPVGSAARAAWATTVQITYVDESGQPSGRVVLGFVCVDDNGRNKHLLQLLAPARCVEGGRRDPIVHVERLA